MVRNRIVGKAVIYKVLHKGNVNYRLMAIERSTSVRIAEPLRNEDCSTANLFSLITVSVNENKCITAAWVRPELLTKVMESTTFESFVGK